jgi:hypothetical protein
MRILTADPKSAIVSTTMSKEKRGIDFVRNLIKGKIAEIIFHHMFSENEFCTVIPFGYENITPLLSQYQHLIETDKVLENIRNNPDFILVKPDHTQAILVDVKYRKKPDQTEIKKIASKILKRWETAWVFLATPDGFYFNSCEQIVANDGNIPVLDTKWISEDLQERFLGLLNEFLRTS